ncbi:MAG: DUF1080 domain-containing protein [Candidatus Marinimicrobia bacterium]|nr:DUF1080 domain-containing protein [Candidatus Neomarinimicrobiota bacterium]
MDYDFPTTTLEEVRIKEFPISVQAWTFRKFTFVETLQKLNELGIKYVEAYPGQLLGLDGGDPDARLSHEMTEAQKTKVKAALDRTGIRMVAYGVVGGIEYNRPALESLFSFAKEMGIEIVVMEPEADDFSLLDDMANEFGRKVAIHNHAVPNKYALPATVLSHVESHSLRLGACGDTGHWARSGIVGADGLRTLSGRIHDVHIKDFDELGNLDANEVPFGQGVAGGRDILAELTLQNYAGYLTIEYEKEADALDPSPAIREVIAFIDSVTYYKGYTQILGSSDSRYNKHGWNHYGPGYFTLDEMSGILTATGGMGLFWYSPKQLKDFVLELEFLVEEDRDNSGIFYRIPDMPVSDDYIYHAFEVQIDGASDDLHYTGAVYDAVAPAKKAAKGAGQWNHYKITCIGPNITIVLNGEQVVNWDMEPRGKIRDWASEGYIGLQNHDNGSPVHFRNIFVKEL